MKFATLDTENQKQSKVRFRRAKNQLFAVCYEENAICAVNTYRASLSKRFLLSG